MAARGLPTAAPLLARETPLAERVDRYGERQRAGTGVARRAQARQEILESEGEPVGWYYFDGEEWTYKGATP